MYDDVITSLFFIRQPDNQSITMQYGRILAIPRIGDKIKFSESEIDGVIGTLFIVVDVVWTINNPCADKYWNEVRVDVLPFK